MLAERLECILASAQHLTGSSRAYATILADLLQIFVQMPSLAAAVVAMALQLFFPRPNRRRRPNRLRLRLRFANPATGSSAGRFSARSIPLPFCSGDNEIELLFPTRTRTWYCSSLLVHVVVNRSFCSVRMLQRHIADNNEILPTQCYRQSPNRESSRTTSRQVCLFPSSRAVQGSRMLRLCDCSCLCLSKNLCRTKSTIHLPF